ncbi:TlpA disulfide reductase family protein [Pseudonocardia sp. KRD291]|uniref:TlpA family protein disulfide reductase n=1 Tax=Pseudonocardia sp. KRD291 TaxID=2792007 RepID=UPI001C4A01D3|nr:TlpA disulfide reductase family protein [Pseudonocardia sp. KRD291]MBW0104186.1 TlpA family protein disulfide reductase [Pseudonocardia sp. KRD291]
MTELLPTPRARRRRVAKAAAVLVAIAAVGIGAVFGSRLGSDPTLVESPLIGRPAPAVTLPLLEGPGEVSLPALRGQIVVVNFWASWCVACRGEHPALTGAARQYQDAGVTFVGVDYQDSTTSATAFLDELGRGGSNYHYVTDPGSSAALEFGLFGVPETFIIDRSGTVAAKITGGTTYPLLTGALDAVIAGRQPAGQTGGPVQPSPDTPAVAGR